DTPADRAVLARPAADAQVIAFDRLVAGLHPRRLQADVADVVLGARVLAAGQVDVQRLIERESLVEVVRQKLGVALRVGAGILAPLAAGAGDEPRAHAGRSPV